MLTTLKYQLENYYNAQPFEWDNIEVQDLTQLTSGWASDVYGFTLKFEEQGIESHLRLVLKVYEPNIDGIDRALKERHALFRLGAAHYPVPGVAAVEIDSEFIERPFIIMEQVNGRALWDVFQEADGQQRQELVEMFVGLLVDLHSIDVSTLVANLKPLSQFALINREIHTMRGMISSAGLDEFTPVTDWLYANRQVAPCNAPVVAHRDYHPWNVLVSEVGRPFVIDWGWQLADPRYDVAWTLTMMERSGYAAFREAVKNEYERVIGGRIESLDYYEVVVTLRWLLNVLRSVHNGSALRSDSAQAFREFIVEPVTRAAELIRARTGIALPPVEQLLQ